MIRGLFNFGAFILIPFLISNVYSTDELDGMLDDDLVLDDNNTAALNRSIREINDRIASPNNIRFNIPDLNVKHKVDGLNVNLQAYKVEDRDRDNQWVSIGEPVLIKNRNGSIYQFNTENIFLQLQLLPDDQEAALINAAKKLNPNIKEAFIHPIPLQSITCKTVFLANGDTIELQGRATNLNRYQVAIKIPCPENSEKRRHFNARIKIPDPVEWDCTFTADGKEKFLNRIDISAEDIQDAAVDHDLFGPQDDVYVTRKQMTLFSQQIRNNLQIEEDYELDEKFDEKVVERLLSIASSAFQYVPIDQALEKLSKFGFSMSQKDLEPDEIKRKLADEMAMVKQGQKYSISTKSDEKQAKEDENESADRGTAELSISSLFAAKANGEVLKKNREKWEKANMSAKDQLNEINKDNQVHTKYEWDGMKIVPKAVKVALLHKNAFSRNIAVSYRKIVRKDARYRKEILITTASFIEDNRLKNFDQRLATAASSIRSITLQLISSNSKITARLDTALDSINSIKTNYYRLENRLQIQEGKKHLNSYNVECSTFTSFSNIFDGKTFLHCPDSPEQNFLHSMEFNIAGTTTSGIKFPPISWKCCHYVFY